MQPYAQQRRYKAEMLLNTKKIITFEDIRLILQTRVNFR